MRKHILVVILAAITCCNAFAQTASYKFTPKWKADEKKSVTIKQHEVEYKKGELIEDTTIYMNAEVTVLQENKDDYTLKVLYENVALRSAVNFYSKLGEELAGYKNLELKYRVDKQTGNAELINWKEAQNFMNESFEKINALLKKKVPDMAGFAKLTFAPIVKMLSSKENIEAYMSDEIGYLLFPYNKKFTGKDTLTIKESCANPFNPSETISQTTLAYLNNIDEPNKTCDININEIYDLAKFKEMMKTMMGNMAKSFGAADSAKNKAAKEIDSIDFDYTNLSVITFNYNSTWPVKVIKTGKVIAGDPRGKTEKIVTTTVMIK